MKLLEICATGLEAALIAESAGANRIELCENLESGGLTPSYGTLKAVKEHVRIPVHVLIRPRRGDYIYDYNLIQIMKSDILLAKSFGYEGVVIGVLDNNANLDIGAMNILLEAAEGMAVTFHRAIDVAVRPFHLLEQLVKMGVPRVLTSGGMQTAEEGIHQIVQMQEIFGEEILIMPGSGITSENIQKFTNIEKIKEIHMSAKKYIQSEMNVSPDLIFSPLLQKDEWWYYSVDSIEVKKVVAILNK